MRKRNLFKTAIADQLQGTNDWKVPAVSSTEALQTHLTKLRGRSRSLYANDDYAKRFVNIMRTNVIGHGGIVLQAKAKDPNGELDTAGNQMLEAAWKRWGKRGVCDVTKRLSWRQVQELALKNMIVDGEYFIRKVRYKNNFLFSLQFIDPDALDPEFNDGNIEGSIEYDEFGAATAYYVRTMDTSRRKDIVEHPLTRNRYLRIPAEDMIHGFLPENVNQRRGIPWFTTSGVRMYLLGQYEDAALTNARISSSKMGFLTQEAEADEFKGAEDNVDEPIPVEIAAGEIDILPPGYSFQAFDPNQPTAGFGEFAKAIMRGVSSGLNISYHMLANDPEGVNYSTARVFSIDDRESWKAIQQVLIENLCELVFEPWLANTIWRGVELPFSESKIAKFSAVEWRPRRWSWVDPKNEIEAAVIAIENGLTSRRRIMVEQGLDPDEIELEIEQERIKYGNTTQTDDSGERPGE